jgi:hypothetical protein
MNVIRRRTVAIATAAAALAVSGLAATAPSASAAVLYEKLEALHSGKVLDVGNASTSANAHVIQFPFTGGANQQWRKVNVVASPNNTDTPDFVLQNRNSGMCLDVEGQSKQAGAHLVQQPCDFNGGKSSQRWYMHKLADKGLLTPKGYRWIFNRNSGLVVDIGNASTADKTLAIQYFQKGLGSADNQMFNFGFGGVG